MNAGTNSPVIARLDVPTPSLVRARIPVALVVNGRACRHEVEPRLLLSDFIRHDLALTGTHVGCEQGACGACTVLVEGQPARSCLMFTAMAEGLHVETVESLADGRALHVLQQAFHECHALQCGYCTPGMLMTAKAFLDATPSPTETQVREALSGNLCRCTGYQHIVDAVLLAATRWRTAR